MKKILMIIFIFLLIITSTIASCFIMLRNLKIQEYIPQLIEMEESAFNEFNIGFSPNPNISFKNISINPYFQAATVKVFFVPLSFLFFKPQISYIKIIDGSLKLDFKDQNINLLKADLDKINNYIHLPYSLYFENIHLTFQDEFFNLNTAKLEAKDNVAKFSSDLGDQAIINIALKKETQNYIMDLVVQNASYFANINENIGENEAFGKVKFSSKDINNIVRHYSDLDLNFIEFKKNAMLNLEADFSRNKEELLIKNFNLDSNFLDKLAGNINIYFQDRSRNNINLNFGSLNIVNLFEYRERSYKDLLLPENIINHQLIHTNFNIIFNDITFPNLTKITNFSSKGKLQAETIEIENCNGFTGDKGSFSFNGTINQNPYRPIFKGKIALNDVNITSLYKNKDSEITLNMNSNIEVTPKEFTLSEMQVNYDKGTNREEYEGEVSIKLIGTTPHISSNMNIKDFDFSSYPSNNLNEIPQILFSLIFNSKNPEYLEKLSYLRSHNYHNHFNFNLINPHMNGYFFDKIFINLYKNSNEININDLTLVKGEEHISLSANFNFQNLIPELKAEIQDGFIKIEDYKKVKDEFYQFLNSHLDLSKFNFSTIVNLQKLSLGDKDFTEIKLNLKNQHGLITIPYFETHYHQGLLSGSGNIKLSPFNAGLTFTINNMFLPEIDNQYIKNSLKQGIASINGNLNIGEKFDILSAKGDFIAKNFTIPNLSLDDFILAVTNPNYNSQNITLDAQKFMNEGQTIIKNMHGQYQLLKGVITLSDTAFTTNYSSGSLSGIVDTDNNILKFSTKFSFFPKHEITNTTLPLSIYLSLTNDREELKKEFNLNEVINYFQSTNNLPSNKN